MRRNTVKLLKYVALILVLFILLPKLLRSFMTAEESMKERKVAIHQHHGMPVEDFGKAKEELVVKQFTKRPTKAPEVKKIEPAFEAAADGAMKDWHDHQQIARDRERQGPGEQGSAVILSADEEKQKGDLYKVNGFNAYVSDKISLDRALKDIRNPGCRSKKYLAKLPKASIIYPFHNEHWTTLLRSVHSVLYRSPAELVHEVILADDFSNKEFLGKELDEHLASNYNGKVKVVRASKREGLIRTRLMGAKAATGDVLIFLDSHVEANTNWLPPLLDPIARDYRTVVCPFIDVIDYETFAYRAQDEGARGAFDWEFFYKRLPLLPEDLKHPADPFKSPVMAGGLFAISTEWFWELGGYDPGLDIWGGEQYELSFKLWQCGGQMLDAPCSRIGHIYRKFAPFPNPGIGDFVGRNYRRVAEVWMDEYAEYLYKRRPHYRTIDAGDISEQQGIRTKLHCKSFKWFMTEVAFDLVKVYPPIEPPNLAEGELRNQASQMCVDTRFKNANERFGLEKCTKDSPGLGGEQRFELSWHHDLRPFKRTVCFDVSTSVAKAPIILYQCHGMRGNQHFKYNLDTLQLFHPISNQCLDCDAINKELYMLRCDSTSATQKWLIEKRNETLIRKDWASTDR